MFKEAKIWSLDDLRKKRLTIGVLERMGIPGQHRRVNMLNKWRLWRDSKEEDSDSDPDTTPVIKTEVSEWLSERGLTRYMAKFDENGIRTLDQLQTMAMTTDVLWRKLRITTNDRRKFVREWNLSFKEGLFSPSVRT